MVFSKHILTDSSKSVISFLIAVASISSFGSEPVRLDEYSPQLDLSPQMAYLVDDANQLSYQDVLHVQDESWRRTEQPVPSFGFSRSTYWFKIELQNRSAEIRTPLLEIANAMLNQLDLYQTVDQQLMQQFSTGTDLPFSQRPIAHRYFLFPLTLQPDSVSVIHVRVQSNGSVRLPITLWDSDAFHERNQIDMLAIGAYFTVLLLALGYILVTTITIPHSAMFALAGFISCFGLFQLATLGVGLEYVWTEYPAMNELSTVFSICFGLAFACWFTLLVLDLKHHSVAARRFLEVMILLPLLTAAAYLLLPYHMIAPWAAALVVPASLGMLFIGLVGSSRGYKSARHFTLSWLVLLIGIVVLSLNRFAVLPSNAFTEQAAVIGFIGMMMMMAWAFSADINKLRFHYEKIELSAERLARAQQETISARLEDQVKERTRELEEALSELSDSNATLMELSTIDSLTSVKNRHYFDEIYLQEWKRATRENYPLSLLLLDIDHFKNVNDTYGHLAGDDCLRSVAQNIQHVLRRPADILARYGGEEFVVVLPYTANENAFQLADQIRKQIESTTIEADGFDIQLTISIGVSTVIPHEEDEQRDLIFSADIALYEAKRSGRNMVRNAGYLQVHRTGTNAQD